MPILPCRANATGLTDRDRATRGRGEHWIGAFGLGGQRLFVFPDLDFVLAVTAGNYDMPDQWRAPIAVLREVFLTTLAA
jgi:hypothetical protein